MPEPITIAFSCFKGGVGKTTLAIHCAQRWAERLGAGVVQLIDTDTQKNAIKFLPAMPQVLAEDADTATASTVRVRVVDTAPTLTAALVQVLLEARFVVVPVMGYGAVEGLAKLEKTIEEARGLNPVIETVYALPIQHPTANSAAFIEAALRGMHGPQVLASTVRRADAFEVAWLRQTTIFNDAPQSSAAQQMRALCDELFERFRLGER